MHNDEGVNTIKFRDLWDKGSFKYDPDEFHGPTLYYSTLAVEKVFAAPKDFNDFTETRFRIVTVLFGVGLILLLPLVADGLGRNAILWAALFTAFSPAMVFYSRYFIHEMLLVFFTFLALAAAWRYTRSRKIGWALLAGAGVGLMQATKETFVLSIAAMAAALLLNWLWMRYVDAAAAGDKFKLDFRHILAASLVWLAVWLTLFSSFFTNAHGLADSITTYLPWMHRNAGASPHIHPWNFYLTRLLYYHVGKGRVWSEAIILILAVWGAYAGFARKGLTGSNAGFIRFIAIYSFLLTAIYSALAYKTPWCLINFWHGMILLAGVGAVAFIRLAVRQRVKIAIAVLIGAFAIQLAAQAWHASISAWQSDESTAQYRQNPYVYSQTSPDILRLVTQVEAIAAASPQHDNLLVKVVAPDSGFWPLPWYLRRFNHIGWWSALPEDPYAPIIIVSNQLHANLDEKKTHVMVGIFELRPQVFLELYVELDLWRSYLETKPPSPDL
jgi:uncharacterized protein (TIGR03663 family)